MRILRNFQYWPQQLVSHKEMGFLEISVYLIYHLITIIFVEIRDRMSQVIISSAAFFVVAALPFYSTPNIDIVLSCNAVSIHVFLCGTKHLGQN